MMLLTPTLSIGQVLTLLTDLEYPKGLWINGNNLYLTETAGRNTVWGGKISLSEYDIVTGVKTELLNNPANSDSVVVASDEMIYLTSYQTKIPGESGTVSVVDPTTNVETHLLNIDIASEDMFIDSEDNILIIGSSDQVWANSIYLLPSGDYTNPIVLQTGLGRIWCISKKGDYIYFGTNTFSGTGEIKRFNINDPSGTIETFLARSVMSMAFSSQYLYYADYFGDTVGRIDIQTKEDEILISSLNSPIQVRYDEFSNELYFLEAGTGANQYKDGTLNVLFITVKDIDAVIALLIQAKDVIVGFPVEVFHNKNAGIPLINKIDAVLAMLDEGNYEEALDKLINDILAKTNGCAEIGMPDNNDWILTCEAQDEVFSLILEAIEILDDLI